MPAQLIFILSHQDNDFSLIGRAFESAGVCRRTRSWRHPRDAQSYFRDSDRYAGSAIEPPAALILDMDFPGEASLDLVRWLRFHPRFRRLTIVGTTGRTSSVSPQAAFEAGIDGFYTVPEQLDELACSFKG